MKISIEKKRKAVTANRGGFDDVSDTQILTIWDALSPETQKQYLESIKQTGKDKQNAAGDET